MKVARPVVLPVGWVMLFFIPVAFLTAQTPEYQPFEQVNFSEKEIYSYVRTMIQDQQGFLWIGTNYGLFRYDGYRSVRFRNDPDDPNSLCDNIVEVTYLDQQGELWLGTENGLDRLDRSTGKFVHFPIHSSTTNAFPDNWITAICEDRSGNLWIGTKHGLNVLDRSTGDFVRFLPEETDPTSISGSQIRTLYLDRSGDLWIGTNRNGLNRLCADQIVPIDRKIHHQDFCFDRFDYVPDDSTRTDHYSKAALSFLEDRQGNLWVGYGGALILFDRDGEVLKPITLDPARPHMRVGIWSLFEDSRNNIWIGTHGQGLFRIAPGQTPGRLPIVESFAPLPEFHSINGYQVETHPSHRIWTIYEDRFNNLWFGGLMGLARWKGDDPVIHHYYNPAYPDGLVQELILAEDITGRILFTDKKTQEVWALDIRNGSLTRYPVDPAKPPVANRIFYSAMTVDRGGNIWLGTNDRGLYFLDFRTGEMRYFHVEMIPSNNSSTGLGLIPAIAEDQRGDLWIATWRDGLKRYRPESGTFDHFLPDPDDPRTIGSARVNTVMEDSRGDLWIGTQNGLSRFRRGSGDFEHFLHDKNNSASISHNRVNAIFEDSRGNFWIGTEGGLNWMNRLNIGPVRK